MFQRIKYVFMHGGNMGLVCLSWHKVIAKMTLPGDTLAEMKEQVRGPW